MTTELTGQVAIVTGAGRGIGRAEALMLSSHGVRVVVNDIGCKPSGEGIDEGPADDVVAEIHAAGGEAIANHDSIADFEAGDRIVADALRQWGRLDIVVNNAAISRGNMIDNVTQDEWSSMIAVNLTGQLSVTRSAAKIFRRQRSGRIITTSSHAGLGFMGNTCYSAAKEGVIGLTRTVARDLARFGVTANSIRPAAVTRLTAESGMDEQVHHVDKIATFVVWLCTHAAADVNGQDFGVIGDSISLMSVPTVIESMEREGGWSIEALNESFPSIMGPLMPPTSNWEPTAAERAAAQREGW